MIKRGDVFFANLPGSEGNVQGFKSRPWVVVQNDIGNEHSPVTIVVPMTTKMKQQIPTHVNLVWGPIYGTVMCEQIRVVDKEEFEVVTHLPNEIMTHVDRALAIAIGLKRNDE